MWTINLDHWNVIGYVGIFHSYIGANKFYFLYLKITLRFCFIIIVSWSLIDLYSLIMKDYDTLLYSD